MSKAPEQIALPLGDPAHRTVRILFVEDSESDYELLKLQMRAAPFIAYTERVEDGEAMQAALTAKPWDLVITDHNLPRFSSREAQKILKAFDADIPFLIVSGAIGEDVAVEAMLNGADDYIMKSRPRRLVPAIERAVSNAAERRDRHLAELRQARSEARLRAITANIPGAVIQLTLGNDPNAKEVVTHVSGGASTLFEMDESVLSAFPQRIFDQFDGAQRAQLLSKLREAAQKSQVVRWEAKFIGPVSHRPRWVLMTASPSQQDEGAFQFDGVLIDITPQKLAEAELHDSREELRALASHLENVKEQERAEIAREIHDDLGGMLTKLKADLSWLRRHSGGDAQVSERLNDMDDIVNQTVHMSTRIARSLRPGILDYGLIPAIEWQTQDFSRRTNITTRFTCNQDMLELDPQQSTAIFRVCQETLTNIIKHAEASVVEVEIFVSSDTITLEINDNGRGFSPKDLAKSTSFGVRGMTERARALGGWLEISGVPGKGTNVMLSIPTDRQEAGVTR